MELLPADSADDASDDNRGHLGLPRPCSLPRPPSAEGRSRTCTRLLRRQMLYPLSYLGWPGNHGGRSFRVLRCFGVDIEDALMSVLLEGWHTVQTEYASPQ